MHFTVECDGFWDVKAFKEENDYGWEFRYSRQTKYESSNDITYTSPEVSKIYSLFDKINDSYHFYGELDPSEVILQFSLKITIKESDFERKNRINLLSGRELYSKPDIKGLFLGTLSGNGSDKKHLRIILPKDKKERQIATDFFKDKGNKITLIYPGLIKERVLLDREKNAIRKIESSAGLYNPLLKEFIFNSSRATETERFTGIDSDSFKKLPEYLDCKKCQLLKLNPSQQEAVVKGLYAKDLCLLQGPPGTGKTTVISELIWQHIRHNQKSRIMLTSQTNLAIDNALNRLFSNSAFNDSSESWRNVMLIKPIRKADSEKVEDEGMPFTKERIDDWANGQGDSESQNNIVFRWMNHIAQRVDLANEYSDILDEWQISLCNPSVSMRKTFSEQYIKDTNVLCMTCGKVESSDFNTYENNKGFDVVIVDEASKATLPELLMPLCYARKSIVIGDHRQLPPVIFEEDFFKKIREIDPELEAELDNKFKKELVNESLFKRLITHPYLSSTIKATFNRQYRMHPDINAIISQFYTEDAGGLECGLDLTKVDYSDFDEPDSRYHGLSFGKFIQPNVHTIWVDVPDGMEQGGEGNSTFNEKEVEAVRLVIEALSQSDRFAIYMNHWKSCTNQEKRIIESKIGVISFYAAQVQRIKKAIQSYCDTREIKVSTKSVDKYQGQESGIVVVSTVRSKRLGFTRTPERLNVALSRARRLLVIVGNSKFYLSDSAKTDDGRFIYRNVIERIQSRETNDVFIDYRDLKKLLGY